MPDVAPLLPGVVALKLPPPSQPALLLPHLVAVLTDRPRTRVKTLLQSGCVHVNGVSVTRHDHPVGPSDLVEVREERAPAPRRLPFPVLFEDAHLIAVHKPCGLLTVATAKEREKTVWTMVNDALGATRERAFVVHRLDKYTSGVLLLAKSQEMKDRVMGNWKAAEKTYHAVVEGTPEPRQQRLVHHLREDERLVVHALDRPAKGTQDASLSYRVVHSRGGLSLLEIHLETGRKNQIRAQLGAIGHPIAGDAKYGAATDPIGRLCLHASRLSVPHPRTGERLRFEADMPREMAAL